MDDDGDLQPARLCEGDAFLNLRVHAKGGTRVAGIRYEDLRDTRETAIYRIRHDSPACPSSPPKAVSPDVVEVLDDPIGDYHWHPAKWVQAPLPVHRVRDMVLDRNGSGLDIDDVRIARDRSHVTVEMDLQDLPPPAQACRGPTPDRDRCRYQAEVAWTLWRRSDPWGPEVRVDWTVGCRPDCRDRATVRVGDGPNWTAADAVLDIARAGEKTLRWTIDKRVFQTPAELAGGEGPGPARLCSGDLMLDFRAWSEGFTHLGANYYHDDPTSDIWYPDPVLAPAPYLVIAEDSPACPERSAEAAGPVAGPASVQGLVSGPSAPFVGLVAAAVGVAFVVGRRSGP